MATITLKEFYEKAAENEELAKKLEELNAQADASLEKLAAEFGYELAASEALDDDDLDDAAGGAYFRPIPSHLKPWR